MQTAYCPDRLVVACGNVMAPRLQESTARCGVMQPVTSGRCADLGLASGVALTLARSGVPSTKPILLLTLAMAASVTDLLLAIAFTFIPLPGGLTELWVHVTTVTMEAIIIPVTEILLRDDVDSVLSTLTIYLVLSGISTLMNFAISVHGVHASMHEVRPLEAILLSWRKTQVAPSGGCAQERSSNQQWRPGCSRREPGFHCDGKDRASAGMRC